MAANADPHMAGAPVVSMKEQEEAQRDGRIVGTHCTACKYDQISPMVRCPKCGGTDLEARDFSTTGKVVSYTIQSVASEQFMNETPFAFAVIQLDDGPKVSGWVPWVSKPEDLPMGSKVAFISSYKPGMQFEKA